MKTLQNQGSNNTGDKGERADTDLLGSSALCVTAPRPTSGGSTPLARPSLSEFALADVLVTLDATVAMQLVEYGAVYFLSGLEIESATDILEGGERDACKVSINRIKQYKNTSPLTL